VRRDVTIKRAMQNGKSTDRYLSKYLGMAVRFWSSIIGKNEGRLNPVLCLLPSRLLSEEEMQFVSKRTLQNYWVSGLCPSSGILKTKIQTFWKLDPDPVIEVSSFKGVSSLT
jgi:hypothetical protein